MDTPQPVPTSNNSRNQTGKGEDDVTSTSPNLPISSAPVQQLPLPSQSMPSSTTLPTSPKPPSASTAGPSTTTAAAYMPPVDATSSIAEIQTNADAEENKTSASDVPQNDANSPALPGAQVTVDSASSSSHPPVLHHDSPEKDQDRNSSSIPANQIIQSSQDGDAPNGASEPQQTVAGNEVTINMHVPEELSVKPQQEQVDLSSTQRPSPEPESANASVGVNGSVRSKSPETVQIGKDAPQSFQPPQRPAQSLQTVESDLVTDSSDPVPAAPIPTLAPAPALAPVPSAFPMPTSAMPPILSGASSTGSSMDPSRSLNVNDALGYLDEVKNRFQNEPDVYNHFLEIMKDFKSKRIDTPRVIERVSTLFTGHPALIQGFNTFLPPGYRIECMTDKQQGGNMIRVTTPHGTLMQNPGGTGFADVKSQESSSAQPWTENDSSKPKNVTTDARIAIKMEESQRQQHLAVASSFGDANASDVQLNDEQQQQSASSSLQPQQQRIQAIIGSSNTGSASPSPAPPLSRSASAATFGSLPALGSSTQPPPPQPSSSSSAAAGAMLAAGGGGGGADPARSLNVNDALGYLDEVKNKFQNNPDVYNHFLEIMKDFKSQRIDTPGVIERVSLLFSGHPALVQGFNTFLPPGYRIECVSDPADTANSMIRVTTPQGTLIQSAKNSRGGGFTFAGSETDASGAHPGGVNAAAASSLPPAVVVTAATTTPVSGTASAGTPLFSAVPGAHPSGLQPTEQAVDYVNRIKERYADDPNSYHLFLDLLQNFNNNPEEALQQIVSLFSQAPDLLEEFKMFLPKELGTIGTDGEQSNLMRMFTQGVGAAQAQMSAQQQQQQQQQAQGEHPTHDGPTKSRRKDKDRGGEGSKEDKEKTQGQGLSAASISPQKRKRKPAEKDAGAKAGAAGGSGPNKVKKPKHHHHQEATPPPPHELNGPHYTNVYQQSHVQAQQQHAHFHPDVYAQAQYHDHHVVTAQQSQSQPQLQPQQLQQPQTLPVPVPQSHHHHPHHHPHYQTQLESQVHQDTTFFDRVRVFLDNREIYDEFLKLVNLFTQELINLRTLVSQAKSFLGETELMAQFREMVGWEERGGGAGGSGGGGNGGGGAGSSGFNGAGASSDDKNGGARQAVKLNKVDLSIRYGPSYRRLPSSETKVACSGRDAFCNSVLNDEWVSHPSWVSEDAGFIAHKKNVYEEALHRSEEERHEYDFYLEAMSKTISALESPYTKIMQMSEADRINYKFKPNWNGTLKTIHQRLLKKVYGREAGMEVVQAIQDNPALAIPIVFQRLKQKEDEWKRAQREWNKVWREVDARNYWKSLDHQGVTFKTNDKKNITAKSFVTNIELVRQQQMTKRASLIDPTFGRGPPEVAFSAGSSSQSQTQSTSNNSNTSYSRPRYQLAYTIEDVSVLQDAIKLVLSFLDRTHGTIAVHDRKKIEQFIRYFVPLFFMYYQRSFDSAFSIGGAAAGGTDMDHMMAGDGISNGFPDDDAFSNGGGGASGNVAGSTRSKNGKRGAGDIRKKLLKATQQSQSQSQQQSLLHAQLEKSTRRTRSVASASVSASAPPSAPASRAPSPPTAGGGGDVEMRDVGTPKKALSATGASSSGKLLNNASTGFQPPTSGTRKHNPRRSLFFANTSLYVLLRLVNLLYSRLLLCKTLGAELAEAEKAANTLRQQQDSTSDPAVSSSSPPAPGAFLDPPAFAFAVTTPAFTSINSADLSATPTVGAEHFYGHLLDCCERLFDNQIDQPTFEDTARYMFGMKAYNIFTVDKVVGAIIKQIQLILSDNKNRELIQLLQKERDNPSMSLQDQNSYREKAGAIVGPDEHLYRIVYIPDSRTFTIQLLGKDDPKEENSLAMVGKWEAYVDAFQDDVDPSAPPPRRRYPFLRRNIRNDKSTPSTDMLSTRNNMETRFCMRTYRMFFVSHTEDVLHWRYPKDALGGYETNAAERIKRRSKWIERFGKDGWEACVKAR